MKILISLVISLGLNVTLTLIGQGRFSFDLLIIAVCLWVAAPLFLFSGVFLAIAYRKPHPVMIGFGQCILLASLILGSTWASIYMGDHLNQREIEKAKKYCEQLAVQLDGMKEQHGSYPTNLVGTIQPSDLPKILQNGNLYYHSQGTNFSITFSDPGGMMSGWDFMGKTRKWRRFD
ncbi:MAG: hypothetical protein PHG65_00700 [Kiritimatiellae bacterium]|nr:hypothetical protein [Kiritimatiellia bacterium]